MSITEDIEQLEAEIADCQKQLVETRKEREAIFAQWREELDAWYGLLNKIDKEVDRCKLVSKSDPVLLEVHDFRNNALRRIGKLEELLGQR